MILACESREYTNDIYMFLSCTQGTPGIMVATMPGLSPASHLTTLSAAGLGAQAQFCGTHLRLWDSTLTYFLSTVDQRDFLSFISSLSLFHCNKLTDLSVSSSTIWSWTVIRPNWSDIIDECLNETCLYIVSFKIVTLENRNTRHVYWLCIQRLQDLTFTN